jgi:hypothetical protein
MAVQHDFIGPPHHAGMPNRSAFAAAAALSVALLVNAGVVGARGAPPAKRQNSHEQLSLERAVRQVQQQTKGRILAADSIPNGRNKLYRIKVLTPDGHVRVMQLRSNDGTPDKDRKHDRSGSGGR